MAALLDRYLPCPDVRSRHSIVIHAPPDVVLDVARSFDINSIALVRAIFWLRSKLLRAQAYDPPAKGLVDWLVELGWQPLAEEPGRSFVAGAACQPWQPNVVFSPMDAKPNHVQIAWTLEAEPFGPTQTLFSTETRVAAVDEEARTHFRRYWRIFRIGILLIRRLLLPAIRREAERQYQPQRPPRPKHRRPHTPDRALAVKPGSQRLHIKQLPHNHSWASPTSTAFFTATTAADQSCEATGDSSLAPTTNVALAGGSKPTPRPVPAPAPESTPRAPQACLHRCALPDHRTERGNAAGRGRRSTSGSRSRRSG